MSMNTEEKREYNKKYYSKNKNHLLEKRKKYRKDNPDYNDEYYAKNKERIKLYTFENKENKKLYKRH